MLRKILSGFTKQSPPELLFKEKKGKLYLPDHPDLHFNLSQSQNQVIIAVSTKPIGVDIEYRANDSHNMAVIKHLFHDQERILFQNSASQAKNSHLFYKIWTQKEAFSKAVGLGFGLEFPQFCVKPEGGQVQPPPQINIKGNWYSQAIHENQTSPQLSNYQIALATPTKNPTISFHTIAL